jgi:hypothetical protein
MVQSEIRSSELRPYFVGGFVSFARFLFRLNVAAVGVGVACAAAVAQPPAPITLVPSGTTWAYLDDGTDQGTAWRNPGFDDSLWSRGAAELGYGDGGEVTRINCGPAPGCNFNNFITTYFRTTFNVTNKSILSNPSFLHRIDDGAVIYLNGTEVGRLNMPPGAITHVTETPGAIPEVAVPTDPLASGVAWVFNSATTLGALVDGVNTIAVEVHQDQPASTDVSFDLVFRATPIPEPASGVIAALAATIGVMGWRWGRRHI